MSSPTATPLLSIGELARQVGAAPSAIRYWERAGLLDPAERVGGRRRYRPDAIDRVGLIRVCQDVGFHIHEIRELLASDSLDDAQWRSRAEQKIAQMKDEIARLQAAVEGLQHTLTCPHPSLSACPVFTAHVTHRAEGPPLGPTP